MQAPCDIFRMKILRPIVLDTPLVIASHNAGKVAEFAAAFAQIGIEIVSADKLNLPAPAEPGATFHENALIKARAGALAAGRAVLADDSGLAVAALGGAPGVSSALWAGPDGSFAPAFARIAAELGGTEKADGAAAAFVCVLALALPDGTVMMTEGRVAGHLCFPARGVGGFGYDPIFVPEGAERSFGEMPAAEKAQYSHRTAALNHLLAWLTA